MKGIVLSWALPQNPPVGHTNPLPESEVYKVLFQYLPLFTIDQEATAIGASYTMGSLGIAVSMHQVDNVNNTGSDDREGYQMVLTFAF